VQETITSIVRMNLKSAEEWQKDNRIGLHRSEEIRLIQSDALRFAAELCRRAPIHENPDLRIVCARNIEAEANKLEPK
jgi:hypothetical protein